MVWQSLYIFAELNIRVQQNPPRKKEKKTTLANHQVEMYKCKGILTSRQKLGFFYRRVLLSALDSRVQATLLL